MQRRRFDVRRSYARPRRFTHPHTPVATNKISPMMASHTSPLTTNPMMDRMSQMTKSAMMSPIWASYAGILVLKLDE